MEKALIGLVACESERHTAENIAKWTKEALEKLGLSPRASWSLLRLLPPQPAPLPPPSRSSHRRHFSCIHAPSASRACTVLMYHWA